MLDPWEGQAGARKYAFDARDLAHALNRVAAGSSYPPGGSDDAADGASWRDWRDLGADKRDFAKAVRIYPEGPRGRPQLPQRAHDDAKGAPSLFL